MAGSSRIKYVMRESVPAARRAKAPLFSLAGSFGPLADLLEEYDERLMSCQALQTDHSWSVRDFIFFYKSLAMLLIVKFH
jgi:hypothetical protein